MGAGRRITDCLSVADIRRCISTYLSRLSSEPGKQPLAFLGSSCRASFLRAHGLALARHALERMNEPIVRPNKPGAVNGGTALRFECERQWPAVTDPERWAEKPRVLWERW